MKNFLTKILAHVLNILTPARLVVLLLAVFFFWFLAFGDQGIYKLRRLFEMKSNLNTKRKVLNDDIDNLIKEQKTLSDPKNLEMVIRKELGYVKPGEVIFEEKIVAENPSD